MSIELKEGDIYRWAWKDLVPWKDMEPYWCKSRICVVEKGKLRDTFWGSGSDYSILDLHRIDLRHVGNFEELEQVEEYMGEYYADADIVNLNHSNSTRGNFYIRKGAKRNPDKMLAVLRAKCEEAEQKARWALNQVERWKESIAKVETGNVDVWI